MIFLVAHNWWSGWLGFVSRKICRISRDNFGRTRLAAPWGVILRIIFESSAGAGGAMDAVEIQASGLETG